MPSSVARVSTDNPKRYLKQLCEHLGRRARSECEDASGTIHFDAGAVALEAGDDVLVLTATAPDEASLERVQDVAGRHLERFGQRNELSVVWDDPSTEMV